jgi:hypothetical protein
MRERLGEPARPGRRVPPWSERSWHERLNRSGAFEVFREGAENSARGGRAPRPAAQCAGANRESSGGNR